MRAHEPAGMKAAVIEPVGGHGGMDYYDFGLCGGLSEAGVDVTLYTCDETPVKTTVPYMLRFPYRRIYGDAPTWLRGARYVMGSVGALLRAKLGGTQVAHFHFFHVGPLELFNVALARMLGFRVVVTAHDVRSFVERLSVPWMVKRAYRLAHRVIAQSEVAERELGTRLRVPMHKIAVIPHGNYLHIIDETPTREEARDRLGLPGEGEVLLFFGQIKEVKGLDILLRAMPRLIRERPGTMLLIAGKVWKDDFERYRRQIEALRISGNCVLDIRFIPDTEIASYYAAADVVVLPYRRIYQSGVLLMAMSYGRPVMVSDIEGMTEVVSNGENGYVFPAGDAEALAERLVDVMSRPEELHRVGARALSHMRKHHGWDTIGQLTAACYHAALKAG